jgi:hypothetical protein
MSMRRAYGCKAIRLHAGTRWCRFRAGGGARNMGRILDFSPLPYEIDRGRRGGFLRGLLARTLVT